MYYSVQWMDLSLKQQQDIARQMTESFQKPWHDDIPLRFFRPSCRVEFYFPTESESWKAASISWKYPSFRYLDKFFVHPTHRGTKGVGREWLHEWIRHQPDTAWLWRTNPSLATGFYGKHPSVITHGQRADYVYQGIGRIQWEAEDIEPLLRLQSCFISR
jgi:hypothetical protein